MYRCIHRWIGLLPPDNTKNEYNNKNNITTIIVSFININTNDVINNIITITLCITDSSNIITNTINRVSNTKYKIQLARHDPAIKPYLKACFPILDGQLISQTDI